MALDPDLIVDTAIRLLDEGGMEALTLRKVAQALDVKAPSLYNHFANKRALVDAVADTFISDVGRDVAAGLGWQDTLRQIASELRSALKSHRDGARVFAGTYIATENVLRPSEIMISALTDAGAPAAFAAETMCHLGYYVMGFVIEEQAVPRDPAEFHCRTERLATLAEASFPHTYATAHLMFEPDFDTRFASGVTLILLGVQQRLAEFQQRAGTDRREGGDVG